MISTLYHMTWMNCFLPMRFFYIHKFSFIFFILTIISFFFYHVVFVIMNEYSVKNSLICFILELYDFYNIININMIHEDLLFNMLIKDDHKTDFLLLDPFLTFTRLSFQISNLKSNYFSNFKSNYFSNFKSNYFSTL